ncbi:DUF4192 domain-containing protein [Aeromicrobium sp. YIM 150415]|uniref:DUF4192 domain-containing protein n=1 Tax=Aeromicrobium sp. YIM 150415 TaxID=2803912 RepID=UPI0019641A30|nr:DUF4192 domain-containing protein [Aeromicrobium sp. YIM 150415]MBM9462673.1 DUF4192 domain-containing protein [Aeromicrobium sp. YIM 150415]
MDETTPYRARTFEDLLNALPARFGFVPRESIIGICVSGPRHRLGFTARMDLPPDDEHADAVARTVVHHLIRNGGDGVILVGLSADPGAAEDMVHRVRELLPAHLPEVLGIWATEDRVWSDLPDCPAEGEPYALSPTHEVRVRAATEGVVVAEDREELWHELEPVGRPRRDWLDRAFADIVAEWIPVGPSWRRDHARQMARLLDRESFADGELLAMSVLSQWIPGRDTAWARIGAHNARRMYDIWAAAARLVGGVEATPMLCLAGFAAWQAGDGARAINALDRARALNPEYTLAGLLGRMVECGMDPRVMDSMDTESWERRFADRRSA